MENIPEKIFLQVDPEEDNPEVFEPPYEGVTWCTDKINDNDVEYIRIDRAYSCLRDLPDKLVRGIFDEDE